jgi:hypothetical protein
MLKLGEKMAQIYDLRNLAIKYHIDIFRLVNNAMSKGLPIESFKIKESDLEKLSLLELIPRDDKVAINEYKYDEVQRELKLLEPDIQNLQQELKKFSGKIQTTEELEKLIMHKEALLKQASVYNQYRNGRIK